MTVRQAVGLIVSLLAAAPLGRAAGQGQVIQKCEIRPGHQLVNSGALYLKSASDTKFEDQRQKDLKDAYRVLTQAVTTGGQEKNPAAWYYLARYYEFQNDLGGADSTFAKAQELAPKCKDEIELRRRGLWVPVFNSGIQAWQAGNTDSAIASFRRANAIYTGEPAGFIYIATLLSGAGQPDSAVKYFKLAVRYADDPKFAKEKRGAMLDLARVYHGAGRLDDAVAAYKEYLAAHPNDVQAMAGLAAAYSRQDKKDEAMTMFAQVVEHADSAGASDLFATAQTILNVIPQAPDTAPLVGQCRTQARKNRALTARQIAVRCDSAAMKVLHDYDASILPQYRVTAHLYEAGLAKSPYDHEALFGLSALYYIMGDSAHALPVATRLYGLDPLNRSVLVKIAGAYQLRNKGDSALYYLQQGELIPIEVTVGTFTTDEQGASVTGLITNIRKKANDPIKLGFELLNAQGSVVVTQSVDVPALQPGTNQQFSFKAAGPGIVAWRYKKA